MVITLAGSNSSVGQGQNEDMSNYRACSIMFDGPSVGPVSFAAFQIRPIVKAVSFKGRVARL